MRLKVLGCHGGESSSHRMTCFMIDGNFVVDAGALTRSLSVVEQRAVDYIYVSHIHLDHISDLATLADNVIGQRKSPVEIYCVEETAKALKEHYFNNIVYPDFSKIPNPQNPKESVIRINAFKQGETVTIGDKYKLRTVPVTHPVPCFGAFIDDGEGTLVYSGDTGVTEELWTQINACENLRALIVEVSFPNNMDGLANISGHLTPHLLRDELKKFKPQTDAPVYLYGMKPNFTEQLKVEVSELDDDRLTMLRLMDEFEI